MSARRCTNRSSRQHSTESRTSRQASFRHFARYFTSVIRLSFWHSHVLCEHMRHISGLGDHIGRPFHHGLCTLSKALARLRSGLLFRPFLVVRILGTIQERLSAVVDGIFSLEPQQIRLSGLGQSRELQLPRTTTSAPSALWALWSDATCQRPVPARPSTYCLCPRRLQR